MFVMAGYRCRLMVFALERPVPRGVQGVHGDEGEEFPEAKEYKENF